MIIDDGVKSRGHRNNLFGTHYKQIGVASGEHKGYAHCTVIEFFGESQKSKLSFDDYKIDKEEWPQDAVSLNKHIESKTSNDKKIIYLTYTFTLKNGEKVVKEKQFEEKV